MPKNEAHGRAISEFQPIGEILWALAAALRLIQAISTNEHTPLCDSTDFSLAACNGQHTASSTTASIVRNTDPASV